MHVDGGAVSQIFNTPVKLDFAKIRKEIGAKENLLIPMSSEMRAFTLTGARQPAIRLQSRKRRFSFDQLQWRWRSL